MVYRPYDKVKVMSANDDLEGLISTLERYIPDFFDSIVQLEDETISNVVYHVISCTHGNSAFNVLVKGSDNRLMFRIYNGETLIKTYTSTTYPRIYNALERGNFIALELSGNSSSGSAQYICICKDTDENVCVIIPNGGTSASVSLSYPSASDSRALIDIFDMDKGLNTSVYFNFGVNTSDKIIAYPLTGYTEILKDFYACASRPYASNKFDYTILVDGEEYLTFGYNSFIVPIE